MRATFTHLRFGRAAVAVVAGGPGADDSGDGRDEDNRVGLRKSRLKGQGQGGEEQAAEGQIAKGHRVSSQCSGTGHSLSGSKCTILCERLHSFFMQPASNPK